MGFRSPLFVLGISAATAISQGGFRTPIPPFNAGGVTTTQGGFVTPIPVLNMGGGIPSIDTVEENGVYRGYRPDLRKQIEREDEEIMAMIMVFLEMHL